MNILFTCGGTAGHINPAVAVARAFLKHDPSCKVLFVGAEGGMETQLVPKEGFDIRTVTISSFYRKPSLSAIRHNLKTVTNLIQSRRQAKQILDDFRPDLVVGTGGYASYPVVRAASRRGIPTAIHESNAMPGLTTKTLSGSVDRVLVAFEDSRSYYKDPDKVYVTGTPVRDDFFRYSRQQAREELGLTDGRPVVLSFFGSLGAENMNEIISQCFLLEEQDGFPFHHIHGAGRDYEQMKSSCPENANIILNQYIYDMPRVCRAADLIISRAGASTVAELTAIAEPSVLVPSPNVTADHQTKNARALSDRGGAILLPEEKCTKESLYGEITSLLNDPERLQSIRDSLKAMAVPNSAEQCYQVLMDLMAEKSGASPNRSEES